MTEDQLKIFNQFSHWYGTLCMDIFQSKNLEAHLNDVNGIIEALNERIESEKEMGNKTKGFENLKNQVCALKYEILERT